MKVKGMAIMPKADKAYPVAMYLHGSGGNLLNSGNDLRQLAELNLAAVDIEYDQTDQATFDEEFIALHHYLSRQRWAKTNAVAWVGSSLGAQRSLSFVLRHPQLQPQLLVRLSGGWVEELEGNSESGKQALTPSLSHPTGEGVRRTGEGTLSTNLHVLLIHGENDEVFPAADCRRLAELLTTNGVPVDLRIFPAQPHGFGADRPAVMRGIAEYCACCLDANSPNYHESPHPLRINTRPLYLYYWLPMGLLTVAALIGGYRRWRTTLKAAGVTRDNWSKAMLCIAWVLAAAALLETTVHLGLPRLQVIETRLNLTRRWLVEPTVKDDFDWLARKPIWKGQKIGAILEHIELADLQRKFFYSSLDETLYRDFILSPVIGERLLTSATTPSPHPTRERVGVRFPRREISRIESLNPGIVRSADILVCGSWRLSSGQSGLSCQPDGTRMPREPADRNVRATGFMESLHGFFTAHWGHEPTIGRSADSHVRELQSCGSRGQGCPRSEGWFMGRGIEFEHAGLLTPPLSSLEGGEGGKSRPPQNVSVPGDNVSGDLNWRRPLWESFYPRIRHETDPLSAAQIVVRFLRERVTIIPGYLDHAGVKEIWERELTGPAGFEKIYVAALRSVGIAARLNADAQAELFADGKWQPAPRPIIDSFLPGDMKIGSLRNGESE
jgi:dienelactone hydrolase